MRDSSEHFLPDFAASTGGDGAEALSDADALAAQHHRKVRALARDETGLHFASLVLFAQPLFELYELDATEAFGLQASPDDADEATVAVLEAARVLWAYFSLNEDERDDAHDALAAFLLGPSAADEDQDDLDELLSEMETHWDAMMPEDHELAANPEHDLLDLDALLAHPAFAVAPGGGERTFGPEGLSEMEARALFAQPLLEALDDPDDLDAAMERADEYWTLAQLRGVEHDAYVEEIVDAFAVSADEATQFRTEAKAMTTRFKALFPNA